MKKINKRIYVFYLISGLSSHPNRRFDQGASLREPMFNMRKCRVFSLVIKLSSFVLKELKL